MKDDINEARKKTKKESKNSNEQTINSDNGKKSKKKKKMKERIANYEGRKVRTQRKENVKRLVDKSKQIYKQTNENFIISTVIINEFV